MSEEETDKEACDSRSAVNGAGTDRNIDEYTDLHGGDTALTFLQETFDFALP
jgi:hypothetical protein